jgi:hypothetical protein
MVAWAFGVWLVNAGATTPAYAQCAFAHGQVTGINGWASMVQAFAPCGAPDFDGFPALTPNTFTVGGIPACSPPQTYHELAGNPANGWVLDPNTGRARLKLDQLANPTDIRIRLELDDIRDGTGNFAPPIGNGALVLLLRLTLDDPAGGDMTTVDIPLGIPVSIGNATGDATLVTTLNQTLAILGQPPLPTCTNVEVVTAILFDPNGDRFLRIGHFRN